MPSSGDEATRGADAGVPPNCPRCRTRTNDAGAGAYRRSARPDGLEEPVDLTPRVRALESGEASFFECRACGGHFIPYDVLRRIAEEPQSGRTRRGESRIRDAARQAYAIPKGPVACARCGGETTRRRWGINGTTYVDVCIDFDCRGVWLDVGELESIAGEDQP